MIATVSINPIASNLFWTKTYRLFFLITLISIRALSQESEIHLNTYNLFNNAVSVYNSKQYAVSEQLFDALYSNENLDESLRGDALFYRASSALKLNKIGAVEVMKSYILSYPMSLRVNNANRIIADYYFENNTFEKALEYYNKVDESRIPLNEKKYFLFKKGYSMLSKENYLGADKYFKSLIKDPEYGEKANYLKAYMAFVQNDYTTANLYFDNVKQNDSLVKRVSFFKTWIYFLTKDYPKAASYGKKHLEKATDPRDISKVNQIVGTSYFNIQKYEDALPYLEAYGGKRERLDIYQLAYAYYKSDNFPKAILEFEKLARHNDQYAQEGLFYLGELYQKKEDNKRALSYFKEAYEQQYNKFVQQEAGLNYIKLLYESTDDYAEVPALINAYLERFPEQKANINLQEILSNAYILMKDSNGVLRSLKSLNTYDAKRQIQKMLFFEGTTLFKTGKYKEAITTLRASQNEPIDQSYNLDALFWEAESHYGLKDYMNALLGYKNFKLYSSEDSYLRNIDYNIGYAYYALNDVPSAITSFESHVNTSSDPSSVADAYARLGDLYADTEAYKLAIKSYNEALKMDSPEPDYITYELAVLHGELNESPKKIEILEDLVSKYPKSQYQEDALYELSKTYKAEKDAKKIVQICDTLLTKYANSKKYPEFLLMQGIGYNNMGKDKADQALERFEEITEKFPESSVYDNAISQAKLAFINNENLDGYSKWVQGLRVVETPEIERDSTAYDEPNRHIFSDLEKIVEEVPQDTVSVKKIKLHYSKASDIIDLPQANVEFLKPSMGLEPEKAEPVKDLHNYFSASLGRYVTGILDFYNVSNIDERKTFFLKAKHRSSGNGIPDAKLPNWYSNSSVSGSFRFVQKDEYVAKLNGDLNLMAYNWYGINSAANLLESELMSINVEQMLYKANVGAKIEFTDHLLKEVLINPKFTWNNYNGNEINSFIKSVFQFPIASLPFDLGVSLNYQSYGLSEKKMSARKDSGNLLLNIDPSYTINMLSNRLLVRLGISLSYYDKNGLSLYPNVDASYNLVRDIAVPFVGVHGRQYQNLYYNLSNLNPYLSTVLDIKDTRELVNVFGGIRGKLSDVLNYSTQIGHKVSHQLPMFRLGETTANKAESYSYGNSFVLVYDDLQTTTLSGRLDWEALKQLRIGINADFYNYTTAHEKQAWNLPQIKSSFFTTYMFAKNWQLTGDVFYIGKRSDLYLPLAGSPSILTLEGYLDANLQAEFTINNQFSGFLRLNNILSNNYERFANYRVQGFQLLIGASYKF